MDFILRKLSCPCSPIGNDDGAHFPNVLDCASPSGSPRQGPQRNSISFSYNESVKRTCEHYSIHNGGNVDTVVTPQKTMRTTDIIYPTRNQVKAPWLMFDKQKMKVMDKTTEFYSSLSIHTAACGE